MSQTEINHGDGNAQNIRNAASAGNAIEVRDLRLLLNQSRVR